MICKKEEEKDVDRYESDVWSVRCLIIHPEKKSAGEVREWCEIEEVEVEEGRGKERDGEGESRV